MSALVDRLAGVLGEHVLHASMNICTGCDWRATPNNGSLAEQHRAHVAQMQAESLGAVEEVEERHVGVQHERGVGCTCGHPGAGCYCPNSNWVGPPIPGTGRRETRARTRVPDVVTDWEEA